MAEESYEIDDLQARLQNLERKVADLRYELDELRAIIGMLKVEIRELYRLRLIEVR